LILKHYGCKFIDGRPAIWVGTLNGSPVGAYPSICRPDPVLYGEALFGPALAEQLGLRFLIPSEDWLVRLPFEYKSRNILLSTLAAARQNAGLAFIKPPNDKSFPAGVYRGNELPSEFPDEMPVLVSDVVIWEKEFRCFILKRTFRAYSLYSRHGDLQRESEFYSSPEEDEQLQKFMSNLLVDSRVDLPDATVVDVGGIAGFGWACVEQNAAWVPASTGVIRSPFLMCHAIAECLRY
jgi:hypothetical protein